MTDLKKVIGKKIAEGKTKIIFEHAGDAKLAVMQHKDSITAGDGARRDVLEGKGALSCRTTTNCFRLLNAKGIPTHYVDAPDATHMIVLRCEMIPVEFVVRRIATGSFLKRHAEMKEGTLFKKPVVEFFFKDDARHDPLMAKDELVAEGVASLAELNEMEKIGLKVFLVLEEAWARLGVTLVDLKTEFGRARDGKLVVADVIDNDSWRLWPHGRKEEMLDKQVYRNMKQVSGEGLALIKAKYSEVAKLTDKFEGG